MNKLQRAYLNGFVKAAGLVNQIPPIGMPNSQPNTEGQPTMPQQNKQPMMPGPGHIAPMIQPAAGSNPGMQQFSQLLQQIRQQNQTNRPAPPAVLSQYIK